MFGYANWYKERHVAAPSRLRAIYRWHLDTYPNQALPKEMLQVRAGLDASGKLSIDHANANCEIDRQYCDSKDPEPKYVDDVAIALVRAIAALTKARIYLLHFEGPKDDPVLTSLPPNVQLISATGQDFNYVIRDNVMGFDEHPGPYWHYAMFTRLRGPLSTSAAH